MPPEPAVQRLIKALKLVAAAGEPCPTNGELAERLGYLNGPSLGRVMKEAQDRGLIVVERGHTGRIVSCPNGTWSTARIKLTPHWRDRPRQQEAQS